MLQCCFPNLSRMAQAAPSALARNHHKLSLRCSLSMLPTPRCTPPLVSRRSLRVERKTRNCRLRSKASSCRSFMAKLQTDAAGSVTAAGSSGRASELRTTCAAQCGRTVCGAVRIPVVRLKPNLCSLIPMGFVDRLCLCDSDRGRKRHRSSEYNCDELHDWLLCVSEVKHFAHEIFSRSMRCQDRLLNNATSAEALSCNV
jgi:hypothetical protein